MAYDAAKPAVELREDQQADLVFLLRNPKALLLHEPGCGKTPTMCVLIYARWYLRQRRTAWIMPKSLLKKNKDELLRFTDFKREEIEIIDGKNWKHRLQKPGVKVFLMGPKRFCRAAQYLPADTRGFDVDEYHLCYQSAASENVNQWMSYASHPTAEFVTMTGTLVNGRLDTAWPPIHCIEPRYYPLGHPQFIAQHAELDAYDRPIAWKNHDRLRQILARHGIRRLFRDIFGPQEIIGQIEDDIELSPKQQELLDELESTAVIELEDMMVDATMPGVSLIRAKQIMEHPEGFPHPKTGELLNLLPEGEESGKEARLRIHLEDHKINGTPFIIFSSHRPQQKRIAELCAEMGLKVGLMNANTTAPQRSKIDEAFQRGELQGVICSDKIAGVGFNWQFWGSLDVEVCHIIFASFGYMDGDMVQAVRRAVRETRRSALRVTVLAYDHNIVRAHRGIIERKSVDANKVDPTRTIIRFKPKSGEVFMRI